MDTHQNGTLANEQWIHFCVIIDIECLIWNIKTLAITKIASYQFVISIILLTL